MKTKAKTNVSHIEQARAEVTFNGKKAVMTLDWEKPNRFYIHVRAPGLNKVVDEDYDPRQALRSWTEAMKKYKGQLVPRGGKGQQKIKDKQLAASFNPQFWQLVKAAYLADIRSGAKTVAPGRVWVGAILDLGRGITFQVDSKPRRDPRNPQMILLSGTRKRGGQSLGHETLPFPFDEKVPVLDKTKSAAESGDKDAYRAYFEKKMKQWGISDPSELSDDKKKDFFNEVDRGWKGESEGGVAQAALSLGAGDKKVLKAFASQQAADGKKLSTDGKTLDGNWMGGRGIAEWKGHKVVLHDLGSKAAQTVQRALKKFIPANSFAQASSSRQAQPKDFNEFNTKLARLIGKGLKKDAGAATIRQNYKGTGRKKARRQLWVNFKSGATIDIWVDMGFVKLGGVVTRRPEGSETVLSKTKIPYGNQTPEQVYAEVAKVLKPWANPAKAAAVAAETMAPGTKIKVKDSHGSPGFRGDTGVVEKYVPFGKYYVKLKKNGRRMVDQSDLEKL